MSRFIKTTPVGETFTAFRADGAVTVDHVAALPVKSLNHLGFAVPQGKTEEVADFYTRVLGFRRLDTRPEFGYEGAWLKHASGLCLHFVQEDLEVPLAMGHLNGWESKYTLQPEPWFERRNRHVALEVDDMAEAQAMLQAHGIDFDVFPIPGSPVTQLFFFDPIGNAIELGNYSADIKLQQAAPAPPAPLVKHSPASVGVAVGDCCLPPLCSLLVSSVGAPWMNPWKETRKRN